ncbi:unnamed protein product [Ranitomeya imitator]|uniref:SSD domain-containing protein n=1 Tax=Ranitomeya imitator TaxID=111125 RepID=A0ABN9MAZ2_9NEOB|nr:unnamed protein product [Ranitomeya imitator]
MCTDQLNTSGCHADCLERPLSRGFRKLGKLIARNPWFFIIIPVILSVGLGAGFYFLEEREFNKLQELFIPEGGIAKGQRDFIKKHFPMNESGQFSAQRLYTASRFASLIIVTTSKNILNRSNFKELVKLDTAVKNLTSKSHLRFRQLCAEVNDHSCLPANPLLASMSNSTEEILITYPMLFNGEYVGLYIGGVTLGPGNQLQKAQALRFLYYLKDDDEKIQNISLEWLEYFMEVVPHEIEKLQLKSLKVYHSTSMSLQKEFEESTESIIPLFSITYVVTMLFSILSCISFDNVRNKIWLTTIGVISPGLAILASFGLLLLCGVPFARTVAYAPFLILGVGVDNMFIIISCWQQTKVTSTLEERMADTIYGSVQIQDGIDIRNLANVNSSLTQFYDVEALYFSKQDIITNGYEIKTSRFFIQAINIATVGDGKNMLTHLRDVTDNCDVEVFVYHPLFIYLDQYHIIIQNTIQNIVVATVVMLVISVLFIPDPLCALWVTFAIASIIAGVTGFMFFWKVNLDSVSMINLVICIGFSVDFSAHIVYASVSNRKPNANQRVIDALHVLGYPIVQGALSTILGIAALSAAKSYIFQTFFKIMLLVITFGALHGLLFIPVFLMTVGACRKSGHVKEEPKNDENKNNKVLPPAVIYRAHPLTTDIQIRKPEASLPGYAISTSNVMDYSSLDGNYFCMSRQGSNYSVLHPDVQKQGNENDGNQGKHRVTKRGPALSYPMFTLVTGIVGRWRAVCVTALQRPNSDAAAIRIVVGIAAASLNVKGPLV